MTEPDGTGQTVLELMRTMGAVRDFADRPVPDAVLHDILDHARFAPSGGNQQPWHVIIVDDPAVKLAIRELVQLGWREYAAHVRAGVRPFAPGSTGCGAQRPSISNSPAPHLRRGHSSTRWNTSLACSSSLLICQRSQCKTSTKATRASSVARRSIHSSRTFSSPHAHTASEEFPRPFSAGSTTRRATYSDFRDRKRSPRSSSSGTRTQP